MTIDLWKDIVVLYGTQTNTAKKMATIFKNEAESLGFNATVSDLSDVDPDDLVEEDNNRVFVFFVSTYTDGKPPNSVEWFYQWIDETVLDFRVERDYLKNMRFALFGLGNSLYGENYNKAGRHLNHWLRKLRARRIFPMGEGDANNDQETTFQEWKQGLLTYLLKKSQGEELFVPAEIKYQSDEEVEETNDDIVDLEDIMGSVKLKNEDSGLVNQREMVTPIVRESLKKQGYKIIGTHSGVKLCRWTKSMLRGRGGCYKHTFYGIESHRCMETTPSLACANKCVFCWRHHTNPVGTEWRWKMDDYKMILDGAMENHYKMIKQLKSIPGLSEERFKEAFKIKHCALSLVGGMKDVRLLI
jgi:tRNA wybutosine-synthesizing protein 1